MRTLIFLFVWVFSVNLSNAQSKPMGTFSPAQNTPSWMSFGPIPDYASTEQIDLAYQKSISTGFLWILQIGYQDSPDVSGEVIARRLLPKFSKLMPYVVAVVYSEEWYERFFLNHFAVYGLTKDNPYGLVFVNHWLARQNGLIKSVLNKPTIWITTMVSRDRPVPENIDFVAIEAYSADGENLAWAELRLLHAEVTTHLPLVVIPRMFKTTGNKQGEGWRDFSQEPTREATDMYLRILARPRYIAMWIFLWESRPYADLVGLVDMPDLREYFIRRIQ